MINESFKVEKKESQGFDPLPENVYQVELLDINAESRPTYDTKNKPDAEKVYERVLNFQFTLLAGKDKTGESLRGRNVWQNFVPTYLYIGKKGKNSLYNIIEAILGHELTPQEEATLDSDFINSLIGSQVRVLVKNNVSDGKTYSNIESFLPIEGALVGLSAEEKDKAKVKKESQTAEQPTEHKPTPAELMQAGQEEINVENIPF